MKSNQTTRRPQGRAAVWVVAACVALACAIPAAALADGPLFGGLMDKASGQGQAEGVEFDLNKSKFSLEDGETRVLVVSMAPEAQDKGPVTWESSDPAVVAVDQDGRIEALAKGTATVTASLAYGEDTVLADSCEVTVVNDKVETAQALLFESGHDYANGCSDLWTYHNPYVTSLALTFDERTMVEDGYDFIEIRDADGVLQGIYTGDELAGKQIEVEGAGFSICLVSDEENVAWGFALTALEPEYKEGWVDDGVSVYYISLGKKATGLWQIDGTWHWFDEQTGAWGPIPEDVEVPKDPIGVEDLEEDEGQGDSGIFGVEEEDEEYTFNMPNLVGMTLWEAQELCSILVYGCDDQWAYSDTVPWGTVMAQDVPADTIVKQGDGVIVTVSAGPEYNAVPDLFGMTLEQAQAALYDIAVGCDDEWRYDAYRPWGTVIAQDVEPGTPVRQGSGVVVTISAGPEPANTIPVPNVCGFWYEDAQWNIWDKGLNCNINWTYSDYAPAGTVIDQSPWADREIEEWGTVTITVSMGANDYLMPDYVGFRYYDPWDSLTGWGNPVVIDDSEVPADESMAGMIYATYPMADKLVTDGSTVYLYIYRHADGTPVIMG